jgi:hypothetical protein
MLRVLKISDFMRGSTVLMVVMLSVVILSLVVPNGIMVCLNV